MRLPNPQSRFANRKYLCATTRQILLKLRGIFPRDNAIKYKAKRWQVKIKYHACALDSCFTRHFFATLELR